jgi:predicted TIM-barrel fold metal-dependent hydrolase
MATETSTPTAEPTHSRSGIVDCDVHNAVPGPTLMKSYLPRELHEAYDAQPKLSSHGVVTGSRWHRGIYREDSFPVEGGTPGSSLEMLRSQLLDPFGISRAILSPLETLAWVQYGPLGAELARGMNELQRDHWLDQDDRLYAAITVPTEDPRAAAKEIRRIAALDRRFVQVLVLVGSRDPLGHARYWEIYEAAVECGLPVAPHVGGFPGTTSPVGSMAYQVARHSVWPTAYQTHVTSLVASGVFDRLPELQFVLEEGGFTWMPSLMWRLDRVASEVGAHGVELNGRLPSEIVREHFYFTTQPIDEPARPEYLRSTIAEMGMVDRIMFASDYPHWDFDSPSRVLREISSADRERVFTSNAERLYPFPA